MKSPVKIVIVDDDKDDVLIVQDLLKGIENFNFEIEWLADFDNALSAIKSQQADVYLVDYMMGARTGFDLLDQIKPEALSKPIIILTSHTDRKIDLIGMEKGASDFLNKSTLTAELLERSIRYSMKHSEDRVRLNESKRLEMEKKAIEAAAEIKSRFVADICHEIRNPLGAIIGFADLAADPNASLADKNSYISVIQRNGEYLLGLLSDVLDISKIEAGHIQIEHTEFNWKEMVVEVVELMTASARAKGLNLVYKFEPGMPDEIRSDPKRIKQILLNLVGNAVKFTEQGSIVVTCRMQKCKNNQEQVIFGIADTGSGIALDDQAHLFEPYRQGREGAKKKVGTGIGLNLSHQLASALGGRLDLLWSCLGKGSEFSFAVPV